MLQSLHFSIQFPSFLSSSLLAKTLLVEAQPLRAQKQPFFFWFSFPKKYLKKWEECSVSPLYFWWLVYYVLFWWNTRIMHLLLVEMPMWNSCIDNQTFFSFSKYQPFQPVTIPISTNRSMALGCIIARYQSTFWALPPWMSQSPLPYKICQMCQIVPSSRGAHGLFRSSLPSQKPGHGMSGWDMGWMDGMEMDEQFSWLGQSLVGGIWMDLDVEGILLGDG